MQTLVVGKRAATKRMRVGEFRYVWIDRDVKTFSRCRPVNEPAGCRVRKRLWLAAQFRWSAYFDPVGLSKQKKCGFLRFVPSMQIDASVGMRLE